MSEQQRFSFVMAWVGALLLGLAMIAAGIVYSFTNTAVSTPMSGVILLLAVAAWVWSAWRSGSRDFAIGVAVGYGLLSFLSGAQCTLFVEGADPYANTFNVLSGFFFYSGLIILTGVIGGTAALVSRARKGGRT